VDQHIPLDIQYAFNEYVRNSIIHFNMVDSNDLNQAEYEDLHMSDVPKLADNIEPPSLEGSRLPTFAFNQPKKDPYDGFIERKPLYENTFVFPTQKKIDLKEPSLRNKGVRKRKNIINVYEETNIEVKKEDELKNDEKTEMRS
jgi:hypothetical protein